MGERVSFSGRSLDLVQIAKHHECCYEALHEFFSTASPSFVNRYLGKSRSDLESELKFSLDELDRSSAFNVLAAIEASLRTDYLTRVYGRKKGRLSRSFRKLYGSKKASAALDRDILLAWVNDGGLPNRVYTALLKAFGYRHWLAHGRYWVPHQNYDYFSVSVIAQELFQVMDEAAS